MDEAFHYPSELILLLVDTIPRLCRAKKDVLLFFRSAGVPDSYTSDITLQLSADRDSVKKNDMVRTVLQRLNENGDKALRERREVLKRIVEWEDFSTCWPTDELPAKGLVAEVRRIVDRKDSFTRMREEKDREREERQAAHKAELKKAEQKRQEIEAIHRSLCALFGATDPWERGKQLESVLNRLFKASGILVKEAFTLTDQSGSVVLEQIDGAIELDGHIYLVEMKWHKDPIGVELVTLHISRLYSRGDARGLIISASNYTQAAIDACRSALGQKVVVLCDLQEIVMLLDAQGDLIQLIRTKARAAVTDKNPYHEITSQRSS